MNFKVQEMKQIIKNNYDKLTPVEQRVADFFLDNEEETDFSSKSLAQKLFVSEAAVSRFAKKCGCKGYREFLFDYLREQKACKEEKDIGILSKQVRSTYQMLLDEDYKILDEEQMKRIAQLLSNAKRVCVYGTGSSGHTAREFQLRYMRIGLKVEAVTDAQMILINAALLEPEDLAIGISLSGESVDTLAGIQLAKKRHAKTILITANENMADREIYDEILQVATIKDLERGALITPQFPILIMIDILYSYYFANDSFLKARKHEDTVSAIIEARK